jgi:hypothetical protein
MFQGVVHANTRKILASYIPSLPAATHVLCSGNFTIETTLRLNGYKGRLSGCDVSLYTCALGCALTGQDLPVSLNTDPAFAEFAPLASFLTDPCGRAAAVAVALDALRFAARKNDYQRRMMDAIARRLPTLCEKTVARIKKKAEAVRLDEFHPQDAWERVAAIPPGDGDAIASFPPTYSAGYERLYRDLHRLFAWQQPAYKELTSGAEFAQRVLSRPGPWILGAEKPTPELQVLLEEPIALAPRSTGVSISLYSNIGVDARVVRRRETVRDVGWRRLTDTDEITEGSRLEVVRVGAAEAQYIRELYSSAEVGQVSAPYNYAVAIDGKLAGIIAFYLPSMNVQMGVPNDPEAKDVSIYMMCDLAVPSFRYPRLSKLVLMASVSCEMQREMEHRLVQEYRYNTTTAFSRNPASMKYRGVFTLLSRKQRADGVCQLNYYSKMGRWTLKDALTRWLKQHSKTTSPA